MKFTFYLFVALSFLLFYVTSAEARKNPCYKSCIKEKKSAYKTTSSACKTNSTSNVNYRSCKLIAKGQFFQDQGACLVGNCPTQAPTLAPIPTPIDWYLGDQYCDDYCSNCDNVCSFRSNGTCQIDSMKKINDATRFRYVAETLLNITYSAAYSPGQKAARAPFIGPYDLNGKIAGYYANSTDGEITCEEQPTGTDYRICCCGPNCPYEA